MGLVRWFKSKQRQNGQKNETKILLNAVNENLVLVQNCIFDVNNTTDPDVYFPRFNQLLETLQYLADIENVIPFSPENPSDVLRRIEGQAEAESNKFLNRAFSVLQANINKAVSTTEKMQLISLHFDRILVYNECFFPSNLNLLATQRREIEASLSIIRDRCSTLTSKSAGYKRQSKIVSLFTKKWLAAAAEEFIVLDIETTGLDSRNDRIVEVSAIRYNKLVESEKFVTLVNPGTIIPIAATEIHHITNQMVIDAPFVEQVIPPLLSFLKSSVIVGHYVNFDISFIEVAARRMGFAPAWNYIDTISIAKKLIPGLPNYKLKTILDAIHVNQATYHRAEDDCRGCAEIILLGINSLL